MRWCVFKRVIAGCICTLYLPGAVFAAPSDSSWERWFVSQIKQHPDAIAAEETMNSVMSMSENNKQASAVLPPVKPLNSACSRRWLTRYRH